ncbi:hypothetical protein QTI66_32670 [Variovorax sp. J22R133]|uniref:hypothetical protein n=1 Tax=Variovorax brevis TaxID=3053503 RepID=UPI00257894F2|nr:hypothetical protein [Variovorax sp. J22R133]MDM0116882.1 hypothetical protein [Variovorax sp. J22R133]
MAITLALREAVETADHVFVNGSRVTHSTVSGGNEPEGFVFTRRTTQLFLGMQEERTKRFDPEQRMELDKNGCASALDVRGEVGQFRFTMNRALELADFATQAPE